MFELFRLLFIVTVCFIFASPFLIFFIKVANRLPVAKYSYSQSFSPQIPVKKTKRVKTINTVSQNPIVNSAIKEFTLPDGSKIAIDSGKVELEEKRVF